MPVLGVSESIHGYEMGDKAVQKAVGTGNSSKIVSSAKSQHIHLYDGTREQDQPTILAMGCTRI